METKTVNTELWSKVSDTTIGGGGLIIAKTDGTETSDLIIAAVNACKDINPGNPLAAAKVIAELIEVLVGSGISFAGDITKIKKVNNLLKQATE